MRTVIALERNNAGHLFIGATDFDSKGYGIRAYTLCHSRGDTPESIMLNHYNDMCRLMEGNVEATPYEGEIREYQV